MKSIKRSWIQLSEELLDPFIKERFPDALIELDRIIPDLITGQMSDGAHLFVPITMEMQKLSVGILDSNSETFGAKFIESASQHHSFTPTMSQLIFDFFPVKLTFYSKKLLKKRSELKFLLIKLIRFVCWQGIRVMMNPISV